VALASLWLRSALFREAPVSPPTPPYDTDGLRKSSSSGDRSGHSEQPDPEEASSVRRDCILPTLERRFCRLKDWRVTATGRTMDEVDPVLWTPFKFGF
jgi:hypothetical protein